MSFLNVDLNLKGANKNHRPLKECSRCKENREPSGGIEMGSKWICAACWQKKVRGR